MNYWIVKGRPAENDFDKWLHPGRLDRWRTARPPAGWAPGDRLFFWKAAPDLCVVGLGELVRIGRRQSRGTNTWFSVKYVSPSLQRPTGIAQLRADRVLRPASVLKAGAAGTLFPLSLSQADRLLAILRRENGFISDVWRDRSETAVALPDIDMLDTAAEGKQRLVEHMRRERDRGLVEAKKRQALRAGPLSCEVCGFDFALRYGKLGQGFCEVHHRRSLSRTGPTRTTLDDLAIVCSNCHRMLHRGGLVRSVAQLRRVLRLEA